MPLTGKDSPMRFEDKVAIVTGNLYEAADTHPTLAPLAPAAVCI
jgi:hypothetical protein